MFRRLRIASEEGSDEWWAALSPEAQQAYLREHPHSRKHRTTDEPHATLRPLTRTEGGFTTPDGSPLPAHVAALRIPPTWTDVHVNPDPEAPLQAMGRDAKGRRTYLYAQEFRESQAAAKYARVAELAAKFETIEQENAKHRQAEDPRTRGLADCLWTIMHTGVRPGESDDKAETYAYGATVLEGRHVVHDRRGRGYTYLRFTGKKGVHLNILVEHPDVAAMLRARAEEVGRRGKLFGEISAAQLAEYVRSLDGGDFTTKDFRTHLGTRTATELVDKMPVPADAKGYKRAVSAVAKAISERLGNTPAIALQSYINPTVFAKWQSARENDNG